MQPYFTGRLPFALGGADHRRLSGAAHEERGAVDSALEGLSEDVLGALECQLWSRRKVVDRLTDYLEMRGVSVKPYRADAKPPELEPADQAVSRRKSRASWTSASYASAS